MRYFTFFFLHGALYLVHISCSQHPTMGTSRITIATGRWVAMALTVQLGHGEIVDIPWPAPRLPQNVLTIAHEQAMLLRPSVLLLGPIVQGRYLQLEQEADVPDLPNTHFAYNCWALMTLETCWWHRTGTEPRSVTNYGTWSKSLLTLGLLICTTTSAASQQFPARLSMTAAWVTDMPWLNTALRISGAGPEYRYFKCWCG